MIINQSASGSQSGGISTPIADNIYGLNLIQVTSDNVARPSSGSNKFSPFVIVHNFGGSAMIGGRNGIDVNVIQTAPTSASNNDRNYQASNFEFYSNQNDTGTNTGAGAKGAGLSIGGAAILDSGATNWLNISFLEANVAVVGTATVQYKSLLQLASLPQDAVHGATFDCMLCMSAQSGAVGWLNGILFGNMNGGQPLATTGCILCTTGSSTVTTGIDLSSYTITGNTLNFTTSTGTATLNANNALVVTSSTSSNPGWSLTNSTSDANAGGLIFLKNRAGGNSNSGDTLGGIAFFGFASAAQQITADIQASQTGAASGTVIPSKLSLLTSSTTLFGNSLVFDNKAHLSFGGTAPTLTAGCNGAGSSVSGTDVSGTITGQTAAATTCTLTFANSGFTGTPNCVAMGQSSPLTGAATPSTTTLVVNFVSTANYKFSYWCPGA